MTGAQVRQARELLGISQERLARLSGVPAHAIGVFERHEHMSPPSLDPGDRISALRAALEQGGVIFTTGEEPGVKLRKAES